MTTKNLGLLTLRLGVGLTLFAHGAQKLFGWFGGRGLAETARSFDTMGFRPGRASALAAGLGEAGGGLLLAAGLATPAAGAAAGATMAVAASTHVPNGFFNAKRGLEFPMTLAVAAASLALTGPGSLSVDRLLGWDEVRPRLRVAALALGAAAAGAVIGRRRRAVTTRSTAGTGPGHEAARGEDDASRQDAGRSGPDGQRDAGMAAATA
ncbi:MAG TPA: DoxX family membrane protein [Acidimicrobiales bacterium]|jgi:putative oxidoreductase|nr:DoxX family membrane protein [Acidimicrobiales bacterium]